jgi:thiamine-phosphate pyrophosphorylase
MKRLIVFSHESDVPNEIALVNELFKEGMELFHLKKPIWDADTQNFFLENISPEFHTKISVHQDQGAIEKFGLKYYHVREKYRTKDLTKREDLKYSTSFHSMESLKKEHSKWDYCFLGPVFNSVSKKGYNSTFPSEFALDPQLKNVCALGGITILNIKSVFERGFASAAVLGSVWNEENNVIKNFKALQKECNSSVLTY